MNDKLYEEQYKGWTGGDLRDEYFALVEELGYRERNFPGHKASIQDYRNRMEWIERQFAADNRSYLLKS